MIPYSRQWIDEEDIDAVVEVLRSDWLTTGPMVERFEETVAQFVGARYAVAVSSGTAALHAAMFAVGIRPGDEVILSPMTFVATPNAVVFQGGKPVFADVDPDALLIDPHKVEAKINPRTKAIIAVDYTGHPCDYDALREIADRHRLILIADGCHSLGAEYKGRKVGILADLTVFSFHPVKAITTGEGGMVVTGNPHFAEKMRRFRNHGLTTDHRQRTAIGTWHYKMEDLGYNYRLTDFQCALGRRQMERLAHWITRRQQIAGNYNDRIGGPLPLKPLSVSCDVSHAYHLYVIQLDSATAKDDRDSLFKGLREKGIHANVHYEPAHLQPFYRERFQMKPGLCPAAEQAYQRILSLPIYPLMTDADIEKVLDCLQNTCGQLWGN